MPKPQSAPERGSVSVEMTLLVWPITVIMAAFIAGAWTLAATGQDVQAAADSAARAASLQPHPSSAPAAAEKSAQAALAAAGRACTDQSVTVDDSHFAHGGHVGVILECEVELRLAGLELPGAVTFEAAARAPIETFRELGDRP